MLFAFLLGRFPPSKNLAGKTGGNDSKTGSRASKTGRRASKTCSNASKGHVPTEEVTVRPVTVTVKTSCDVT